MGTALRWNVAVLPDGSTIEDEVFPKSRSAPRSTGVWYSSQDDGERRLVACMFLLAAGGAAFSTLILADRMEWSVSIAVLLGFLVFAGIFGTLFRAFPGVLRQGMGISRLVLGDNSDATEGAIRKIEESAKEAGFAPIKWKVTRSKRRIRHRARLGKGIWVSFSQIENPDRRSIYILGQGGAAKDSFRRLKGSLRRKFQ